MLSKASFWLKFHTIYWDSIIQTEGYNSKGYQLPSGLQPVFFFFNETEWNKISPCFMWSSQKKKKKNHHNKNLVSVYAHEHPTANTQPHNHTHILSMYMSKSLMLPIFLTMIYFKKFGRLFWNNLFKELKISEIACFALLTHLHSLHKGEITKKVEIVAKLTLNSFSHHWFENQINERNAQKA